MSVAVKYAIFALLATAANIAAQDLSLALYDARHAILLSVAVGTAVGLLLKYQLDKRYIFGFSPGSLMHDSHTFALYTGMGLLTTAIFWGFEFGFHLLFNDKLMRYLGGVIGLAIGYWMKYHLDKRFVFVPRGM